MAYGVKYRCTHKTDTGGTETTHVIEILKNGFSGTVTDVKGGGDIFAHHYEKIDPKKPLENPIQKGRLEFFLQVRGQGTDSELGYDGQSILDEIFVADEEEYQMRKKIDGTVQWTGYVLSDFLEYPEGQYAYTGKIVAKDSSRLSGIDFPLTDDRVTIIDTIADLLDDLGFGLDIHTYTSWITEDTTDTDDFLNQIYNERFALRQYARSGEESDQSFSHEEALTKILKNYGLILRQSENAWKIYQLTALEDPTSVNKFVYDSTGTQQSSSTVDLTTSVDRVDKFILPSSTNQILPALKRVTTRFNHRSKVAELTLPRNVYITGSGSESYSESFISTGEQEIQLSASVIVQHAADEEDGGYVDVLLRVGQYYYDGNNWTTTTSDRVRVELQFQPVLVQGDTNYYVYKGFLNISTPEVPSDATTPIEVEFSNANIRANPDVVADETGFENISFNVNVPGDDEVNSAALDYQLTQSGTYSVVYDVGDTLFGDGPAISSKSALRFSSTTTDITSTSWQRRGTTTGYRTMHENLLKEVMDVQRSATRDIAGVLWGTIGPEDVIVHESNNYFFLGGTHTGKENQWDGHFLKITVGTGSDTFETIIRMSTSGVQEPTGGSGISFSWDELDGRFARRSNNGSDFDSAAAVRSNIGLSNASADLDLNSISVNGTNLFPSDDPQSLGTSDSPTFAGATFNGQVEAKRVNHQILIHDTDNGKEWSITTIGDADIGFYEDASTRRFMIKAGTGNVHANDFVLT